MSRLKCLLLVHLFVMPDPLTGHGLLLPLLFRPVDRSGKTPIRTSPGDRRSMRRSFDDELEELRLQVELMSLLVGSALDKTIEFLSTGEPALAADLLASDDEIDAMHVSLTERCYEVLVRESPRATDLRLVVSVIRVLTELERIGDLCLRIAKIDNDYLLLASRPPLLDTLCGLAQNVRFRFAVVQEAWAANSIDPLVRLDTADSLDRFVDPLLNRVVELEGQDAARIAIAAFVVGRSLDRIGDHTQILSARLRYLITGDSEFLADEVI